MRTKIATLLLTLSIALFFNCSNDDDNSDKTFNANVLRQGDKCGYIFALNKSTDDSAFTLEYLIEFNENVTDLPVEGTRIYYAANLPEELKIEDLQVNLTYRDFTALETPVCNTVEGGDDYPFIYVLTAE